MHLYFPAVHKKKKGTDLNGNSENRINFLTG